MARLDALQFGSRRRIPIGTYEIPVVRPSKGVLKIWGRMWYLRSSKKVMIKIRIIKSKTNNGVPVSKTWEEDWAAGGRIPLLKGHLKATVSKYHKLFRSGEWPEEDNYLTRCNVPWSETFQDTSCASCSARYCTVVR